MPWRPVYDVIGELPVIMKRHIILIAIPLVLTLLMGVVACSGDYATEKEPNNTFHNANTISERRPMRGFIDSSIDRDIYVYRSDRRGCLEISLTGIKGVNLAIKVWRGGNPPVLLKVIDDNRKSSPERMANLAVTPGSYYFEVTHGERDAPAANKDTHYELLIKYREIFREETEPNDGMNAAVPLIIGREITGFFSPALNRIIPSDKEPFREEDWYSFEVGERQSLPMIVDLTLTGVAGVNSVLAVVDSRGREIAAADNGSTGEGEELRALGLQERGTYYVVVYAKGAQANHDEPYTLKITAKDLDTGKEIEKNDTMESANAIINDSVSGRIDRKDDIDFFLYKKLPGRDIVRIELRCADGLDGKLALYNGRGSKPFEVDIEGRGGRDVYPDYYMTGDLYCSVSMKGGMLPPSRDYVLFITPLPDAKNMEKEPNNEIVRATPIENGIARGYISTRDDRDCFSIVTEKRSRMKFEVRGVRGGEMRVSITDQLGYELKTGTVRGDDVLTLVETVDKKAYIILDTLRANFDYPYTITVKAAR